MSETKLVGKRYEKIISMDDLQHYTDRIVGKVKTLIDASISEPTQNKAAKDLVQSLIWSGSFEPYVDWMSKSEEEKNSLLPGRVESK